MTKIAIVGDIHIREDNPRSRRDTNYFDTCLWKIDKILENNDYMIVLGDLFNRPSIPIEYLNYLVYRLDKYRGRIFTILGNHDAYHRTLNLDKTTVGLLNNIGIINLKLSTFNIDGISFDVASVVPDLKLPEKKSDILLGHFYLDNSLAPKESMSMIDLRNYTSVFLGHDHCPYEPVKYNNTTVYRNGSLMRVDSQNYNLKRNIIQYIQINDGILTDKVLTVQLAECVFVDEVFDKPVEKINCDLESLENLIASFKSQSSTERISTLKVLRELETPDACVEYLRIAHESLGLSFD